MIVYHPRTNMKTANLFKIRFKNHCELWGCMVVCTRSWLDDKPAGQYTTTADTEHATVEGPMGGGLQPRVESITGTTSTPQAPAGQSVPRETEQASPVLQMGHLLNLGQMQTMQQLFDHMQLMGQ